MSETNKSEPIQFTREEVLSLENLELKTVMAKNQLQHIQLKRVELQKILETKYKVDLRQFSLNLEEGIATPIRDKELTNAREN